MVHTNGTRIESQWVRIERTGKRKYSVPRLASARGEEKARRAMPTRSGTDPGGSRAPGPLSRWFGTSGNKVGVGSLPRTRRAFLLLKESFPVAVGIEVAVAVTRLAKHSVSISLFVRFVKN